VRPDSSGVRKPLVRVTGLAIDNALGEGTAYVAHEVWRQDERCMALQVSAMPLRYVIEGNPEASWRPVFVTSPCILPGLAFDPSEGGGRLALLPDGTLLLSVGDYGQNSVPESAAAQQPESDYGKTIRISRDGVGAVHTMGHRNPQGLVIDLEGNVWAAEHGPKGGDEINLLKPGANYGWPLVTYGTDYDRYDWRGGVLPRTHGTFTEPAFAFVPSVAISSLLTVRDTLFAPWRGDVLAGSLGGGQILRLRIVAGRILYVESIAVGRRIRDMAEGADGRIVLWTDGGDVLWLSPSTAALGGAALFEMCIRCHSRSARGSDVGPRLAGLFDRPIASNPRFEYSDALRRLEGDWTDERLDAFLKSPATFVPGTTMQFSGMADSSERRVLREYLRFIARERLTF
jgi:cytochrome c2